MDSSLSENARAWNEASQSNPEGPSFFHPSPPSGERAAVRAERRSREARAEIVRGQGPRVRVSPSPHPPPPPGGGRYGRGQGPRVRVSPSPYPLPTGERDSYGRGVMMKRKRVSGRL